MSSGVCVMLSHRHAERLDKFDERSLKTRRSSLRQLMCLHSTIGLTRVLDICTHYLQLYLPSHRESVCISLPLQQSIRF